MITELERLHQLFTQGALTETEFTAAKASLLKGPSADLLKLDELRDELNRLQRDWDEERRKIHFLPQDPARGKNHVKFIRGLSYFLAVAAAIFAIAGVVNIINGKDWIFLMLGVFFAFESSIFHYITKKQSHHIAKFAEARQTYETHRAELEAQIAALRNQLRGEVNGN